MNFRESDKEGALTLLEFIFYEQMQFKTSIYIYRVVENSMGYPNI